MFFRPQFRPGVNKRDRGLQNEGGFGDSNRVRFEAGQPQPLGGWQIKALTPFEGKARGIHAWRTLQAKPVLAFGTSAKLYGFIGGMLIDITPPLHETTLENVFTTVSGSPIVTVHLPFHRLVEEQEVTFSNHQSTIGGLTIEGTYTVTEVLNPSQFTITAGSNASSTVSTPGGGFVDFYAALPEGRADTPGYGYGTGSYGAGPYGTSGDTVEELTLWTLDNWGEYLLANLSGYGIFEWQPENVYAELAFNGGFDGNANGWALGTGWSYASNAVSATAGTASNLSQNFEGVMEGGRTYRVTADITRTAGSLKFRINAGTIPAVIDVGTASSAITKSGTYSRTFLAPADPIDIVFEKDAAFAGSIDNVSIKLESKAVRITTAPPRVDAMFVDPRGIVVALGTTLIDGTYSPMAVRTSDLGNNRAWVPDTDSLASEETLRGSGGRLMAGLATAEQNLVWSDDGVFSLQWNGQPGAAYKSYLLGTKCGLLSRHAKGEQNGFVFWATNTKQFCIFRGISANSLGKPEFIENPVQEDVFDNIDWNQVLKSHVGINPQFSEAWFFYPDTRDVADGGTAECSRVAVVDWTSGTWVTHEMERTAWQASGVFPNPIALTANGRIYEHEIGNTANGALLGAWIETSDMDADEGDTLLIWKSIIPDFTGQVGNITFTIKGRNYPNEELRVLGTHVSTPTTRRINFRYKCRQFVMRTEWTTTGGWGRYGAHRFDIQKTQSKR